MIPFRKAVSLLLAVVFVFSSALFAFAEDKKANSSEEKSDLIQIEVETNKSKYRTTSTAKITVTVTNNRSSPLFNVKSQAIFNELVPVNKRISTTHKSAECLQPGDSFTFSYRALLNAEEFELGLLSRLTLIFKKFFKGAYHIESADHTGKDITIEKQTDEISFGKFRAENLIEVAYSTKEPSAFREKDNPPEPDDTENKLAAGTTTTVTTTKAPSETTTAPQKKPSPTEAPEADQTPFYPVNREKMYSDDYILPSDSEYITSSDLDKFDYYEMDYVTNEIYARHGYIFKTEKFARYFESKSWYRGTVSDMSEVEKRLSVVERKNLDTIVAYEKALGWRESDTTKKSTENKRTTTSPATTANKQNSSYETRAYSKYISFLKENAGSIGQCDAADINGDGVFDLIIESFNGNAAVYTYNDQYGIYGLYSATKGKGSAMDVYYSVVNQLVIFPTADTGGSTYSTVKFNNTDAYITDTLKYNNGKFESGCFYNGAEITAQEHDKIVDSYKNQYYTVDGNVSQLIGTLEDLI